MRCKEYLYWNLSKVAEVLWNFKVWIENQSGYKIQAIRSDNGIEYTSDKFTKFCEEAGIEYKLTAPYAPQQNGVKRDKLNKRADPGIFIGYSSVSKAYKVFQHQFEKIVMSKDIQFAELEKWHWEEKRRIPDDGLSSTTSPLDDTIDNISVTSTTSPLDDTIDNIPVRGTRSLSDVYQRCNVSLVEPKYFVDVVKDPKWIEPMKGELNMIEKNQTWVLVDRPEHKKVIMGVQNKVE
ncbi:uncharacterized protein LOC114752479 [Neltuma alba]|uniref:uncharacterized protein LOC114752479 n=1 Tax=Neltuma alba TaxID=207710 RepID=UPI0010A3FD26|nr:uncharacterized protein LOC114752479 [Prosopis alba]